MHSQKQTKLPDKQGVLIFGQLHPPPPTTTMCVKEKWVVGHSHRHCSHSCDWGHWLLFLLLNHLTAPQTGPWRLTAHTWLHYVQYARVKHKHLDRCYQVWKLSLTAWPTPKTALDPLTASWPWSQPWLWCLWEWPPLGNNAMGWQRRLEVSN